MNKAQRELLDAVCGRFGLSRLQLLAQPVTVTQSQILEVRPELRNLPNPFHRLPEALKEYSREPS